MIKRCLVAFLCVFCFSSSSKSTQVTEEDKHLEYVSLDYKAPPKCPQKSEVLDRISTLLSRSESSENDPVTAQARIKKSSKKIWTLHLKTTQAGETGERTIEDVDCDALADSASLIIAMMLDPQALGLEEPVEPEPEPVQEQEEEPEEDIEDDSKQEITPYILVSLLGDLGTLPKPSLGATISGGFVYGRIWFELEGDFLGKRFGESTISDSAGGDLWFAGGALSVGWLLLQRKFELSLFIEADLGAIVGEGSGISNPSKGAAFWLAPGAGLLAAIKLTDNLKIHLKVVGLVPVFQNRFILQDIGVVHEIGPVSGRLALGLGWYF